MYHDSRNHFAHHFSFDLFHRSVKDLLTSRECGSSILVEPASDHPLGDVTDCKNGIITPNHRALEDLLLGNTLTRYTPLEIALLDSRNDLVCSAKKSSWPVTGI